MSTIGYIHISDGLTFVDDSNSKHRSVLSTADDTQANFYTLPNGTKVNYDGTADATTVPGTRSQHVVASSSTGVTQLDSLIAKQGDRGSTQINLLGTAAVMYCSSVLLNVQILASSKPSRNFYEYIATFEMEDSWHSTGV